MSLIIQISNDLYLSYKYVQDLGIPKKTVEKWRKSGGLIIKKGIRSYVCYSSIPANSRKKLPSEDELKSLLNGEKQNDEVEAVYRKLQYAQTNHFNQHRTYYRDRYAMDAEKAFKTALKRAVWERILELHKENCTGEKGTLKKGFLVVLSDAYNKLYPAAYTKISFSNAILRAKENGIDDVVVDRKRLGLGKPNLQFDDRQNYFLRTIMSNGKAFKSPAIHEKMLKACEKAGIPCPSVSWIKMHKRELLKVQPELYHSRYGADAANKMMPYIGLQPALYADDQYQVDGWDLPFYYLGTDRNGNQRLKKMVLIAVKDACTRKIVGFEIGHSENRLTLFKALQEAIANTGAMPFELVTDNHSYNETKEVDFFVQEAKKIGMTWTVDSNPQRKAIVERGFKDLGERFCKDHYGYIGQGIRTKDKDGRSKPELIDQYQKSGKILSEEEIRAMGIQVVMEYNKTPLKAKGKSPNQLYDESEKPKRIEIDLYERLRLFTMRSEIKVTRGQLNITVAGIKYEYQLNAETIAKYNSKTVAVRYESLNDRIYLFDIKTDQPICDVRPKQKAHGALANQTPEDKEIFNQHTGRIKGVKVQARKENEEVARKAYDLDPRSYEIMNWVNTPKDVLKMAEQDADYKQMLQRQGLDLNRMATVTKVSEIEIEAFKAPPRSKLEKSPMTVKGNKISIINPDEQE